MISKLVLIQGVLTRAANYFSFLKGHMSDQVSILVGRLFYYYFCLSLFTYYFGKNICPGIISNQSYR